MCIRDRFQLFEPALRNDMAYVCLDGEKVVGLLAYSDNKRRAFDIERSGVSRGFGPVKSRVIKTQLMFIIGKPAVKRDDEGYIDFLTTDPACRGQGIATKMINCLLYTSESGSGCFGRRNYDSEGISGEAAASCAQRKNYSRCLQKHPSGLCPKWK